MIELIHLVKKFPDATPIKDLNATINRGDVIAVIGPSGTGKSTLLRCINMLDPPTSGQILFNGTDITSKKCDLNAVRRKIGMVFQSFNLFDHMTVLENVMYAPIHLQNRSKSEAYGIAKKQLESVGLFEKAFSYPDELSGGQKQRVSIARTLAMDPEIILLDEPTSALDPTMVREVENVICELAKTGKTMIIVTHEMRLARAISNRVFYLDNGVLYEDGTPEQIFDHPVRERTRAFIRQLKVFKYKFLTDEFDFSEYSSRFDTFVSNSRIPSEKLLLLRSVLDRFVTEIVPIFTSHPIWFDLITEYSSETDELRLLIYYNNKYNLEKVILNLFGDRKIDCINEPVEDRDYTHKLSCIF